MPMEWYSVLRMKGVDPVNALLKLKYEYTVADVHDLMEISEIDNFLDSEEQRITKGSNPDASR